jgi:hypothetical protein
MFIRFNQFNDSEENILLPEQNILLGEISSKGKISDLSCSFDEDSDSIVQVVLLLSQWQEFIGNANEIEDGIEQLFCKS